MSLLARGLRRRQSGGGAVDVSEVFSTTLYTGNGSTQTITNGIDLAGQGGMIWAKRRNGTNNHVVVDSKRSDWQGILSFNSTGANSVTSGVWEALANGYKINAGFAEIFTNSDNSSYVSWTFRKSAKFFDVVTYTGDGVGDVSGGNPVNHSLGVVPGLIIIKCTSNATDWCVAVRNPDDTWRLAASLNLTGEFKNNAYSQYTVATDSYFRAELVYSYNVSSTDNNGSGETYVAYLFAHDPDGVIQCGSYTGNGSATGPTVSLGWEPQYLLIKNASGAGNWLIYDNQRDTANPRTYTLKANTADVEVTTGLDVDFTATGFQIKATDSDINTNAATYIYLAIKKAD
jgi:hypothetical protein